MNGADAGGKLPGKRLVVCLDGTWNTPDEAGGPTNVVKLQRAVRTRGDDGVPQVTFYDKGVGTGNWIDKIKGGVSGYGLDENVLDGYRFLANNYEGAEGGRAADEIYLFGFSRGAFTARSLGGLIGRFGLLAPGDLNLLKELWALYHQRLQRQDASPALRKAMDNGYEQAEIACVGVWDTVGALGIPLHALSWARQRNTRDFGFHDTELGPHVRCALHAVAIDEGRGPFEPTLWSEPVAPPAAPPAEPPAAQTVEQVWFPGVHSNVGGSYPDAGLADGALRWMMERVARCTRLRFDPGYVDETVRPNAQGTLYESSTGAYAIYRTVPLARLIAGRDCGGLGLQRKLNLVLEPPAGKRFIAEKLHESALERFGRLTPYQTGKSPKPTVYRPRNLEAALELAAAGTLPVVDAQGEALPLAEVRRRVAEARARAAAAPPPAPPPERENLNG